MSNNVNPVESTSMSLARRLESARRRRRVGPKVKLSLVCCQKSDGWYEMFYITSYGRKVTAIKPEFFRPVLGAGLPQAVKWSSQYGRWQ